ncbi:MAG: DNA primase [Bacteroidetes bacterium]|jgi:DNA primase|nr:DNA primase [Bacteroidota bacterium]
MIPADIIQEIKDRAEIEDVVGDFVGLKRRGSNLLGLCPFHTEKTPSFTVNPARNFFKCFGCQRSGDPISFVMEHEHYSYPEALAYLAKKYGIKIPEDSPDQAANEAGQHKESLYIVLQFAEQFYRDQLNKSEEGIQIAKSYLKEREIWAQGEEDFKLGYAPGGWDTFVKEATGKGYKENFLIDAGLAIKKESGGLIDRFRERVMFPIHSLSGRCLGFGGRTMKNDKKEAKYLNSPETELYHKSEILYGIYQARRAIKTQDMCYMTEGYMDVIMLHQKGLAHVVAASGTSLTEGHLRLVRRYTDNICFVFDGDKAGIKAALRAIDLALEEGFNVKALALPQGEDPDSFARRREPPEIQAYFEEQSTDFIQFKAQLLMPQAGDDPLKKWEVLQQIVQSISLVNNGLKRILFIQKTAKMLGIGEEVLMGELNKQMPRVLEHKGKKWLDDEKEVAKGRPPGSDPVEGHPKSTAEFRQGLVAQHETYLVRFILKFGHLMYDDEKMETVAEHVLAFLEEYDAYPDNEQLGMVLKEYQVHVESWGVVDIDGFLRHPDETLRKTAQGFLTDRFEASVHWTKRIGMEIKEDNGYKRNMERVIHRYKLALVQRMIHHILQTIQALPEGEGPEAEALEVETKLYIKLLENRRQIAANLGIVVM